LQNSTDDERETASHPVNDKADVNDGRYELHDPVYSSGQESLRTALHADHREDLGREVDETVGTSKLVEQELNRNEEEMAGVASDADDILGDDPVVTAYMESVSGPKNRGRRAHPWSPPAHDQLACRS
jgi:hypothetical protein